MLAKSEQKADCIFHWRQRKSSAEQWAEAPATLLCSHFLPTQFLSTRIMKVLAGETMT